MRSKFLLGLVLVLVCFTACGDKKDKKETAADPEQFFENTSGAKTMIEVEKEELERSSNKLEAKVEEMNKQCPREVDPGIVMTSVELVDEEYITTYEVDEEQVDFPRFCKDLDFIKSQTITGLKISAKHPVNQLFKQYHTTLTSVYIGKQTGKHVRFTIKPNEW